MIEIFKNIVLEGVTGKSIVFDVTYEKCDTRKPVIIYAHGFKGFKDWGNFDIIARYFVDKGYVFIKLNFSHNGMTPEKTLEFTDLEAFGENNATKELADLKLIVDWVYKGNKIMDADEYDPERIFLIGHSRGGGICIIQAKEDARIKKVATWASITSFDHIWANWGEKEVKAWQQSGVAYTINSRTGEKFPLHYQLYEDFQKNKARLDLPVAIAGLKIPILICHGDMDEVVPLQKAEELAKNNHAAKLIVIPDGDHVFGRKHPWNVEILPLETHKLLALTEDFFNS